jgi:glycogen synthase
MLGWEYPPHITGGLGTACEGLTRALSNIDIKIDFVVPELIGDEKAPHMSLIDSSSGVVNSQAGRSLLPLSVKLTTEQAKSRIERYSIPAFLAPYWTSAAYEQYLDKITELDPVFIEKLLPITRGTVESQQIELSSVKSARGYLGDLFQEVERYAANVILLMSDKDFDVIHAHDWITFPAAVALAKFTSKPLIVHIHSLESDRCGDFGDSRIANIERYGLESASAIVAVSHYTAGKIARDHGIALDKIQIVHNGVYSKEVVTEYKHNLKWQGKIVLFLGRVTFQKGPDYFVEAAAKVIPYQPDVLFVMAGAGDMLPQMIERVNDLGIGENFRFTGFLKGKEVEEMFSIADLYVMPSVSEPFGLSALEAINFETPVIVSKQSGVSEVLGHSLKVDFWDTDSLANLIINCLLHEELGEDMIGMAKQELSTLRWDAAALKMEEIYSKVLDLK